MDYCYYVYILASRRNGTLYVGVTNDLSRRVWKHRQGTAGSFTKKYGVFMLVWYEHFQQIHDAIACEKRLKRWRRAWKLALIETMNRDWRDLYETLNQ
jgi:putative endonuclease